MKYSIAMMISGLILCSICIVQLIYIQEAPFNLSTRVVANKVPPSDRERITFILGEDKDAQNPYYGEATVYYTHHPEGRTEYLVTSCRSLVEVRDYLERYTPCNGQPWGLINLVSHGNQWVGMSVRVAPDSKRTTPESIREYISNGTLEPLPKYIVDHESEIFVHGCGLGNNHQLIEEIATAFGGDQGKPIVRASRLFEYYSSVMYQSAIHTQRYVANAWFVSYPMGEKPSVQNLMQTLRDKYPLEPAEWSSAMVRTQPRWTGDFYHYTFEVPVKWVLPLDGGVIGELKTRKEQLEFVEREPDIKEALAKMEIPASSFKWTFARMFINNEDGTRSPAILVKGYATILTVIKALTIDGDENSLLKKPFQPDVNDLDFYYSSCLL